MSNLSLTELKDSFDINNPKQSVIDLLAKSKNIPRPMLAMVYMRINSMSNDEVILFANKAFASIELIESGQMELLHDNLTAWNIPAPIIGVILNYATHIHKNK